MPFTKSLWAMAPGALALGCAQALPLAAQSSIAALPVPAMVMRSHCITQVSPSYPPAEPELATSVVLHVVISNTGMVLPLSISQGRPQLENNALAAVRLWRYKPYLRNGRPIAVATDVEVDFTPMVAGGMVTHPER